MRLVVALMAAVSLGGCAAAARVEGGSIVEPGGEPVGTTLGHWKMDDCRDASGGSVPASSASIGLVRMIDGRVVLMDAESGRDTLVVNTGVDEPGARIFQVRIKSAATNFLLREYRLPIDGAGPGRFAVQPWTERGPGFFLSNPAEATLSCALVRV